MKKIKINKRSEGFIRNPKEISAFKNLIKGLKKESYFLPQDAIAINLSLFAIDEIFSKLKERARYFKSLHSQIKENDIKALEIKIEKYEAEIKSSETEHIKLEFKYQIQKLKNKIHIIKNSKDYLFFNFDKNGKILENKEVTLSSAIKTIHDILANNGLTSASRMRLSSLLESGTSSEKSLFETMMDSIVDANIEAENGLLN